MFEVQKVERWRRWVVLPGLLAVLLYLLLTVADSMTFHPAPYPEGEWDWASSLGAGDVFLTAEDGVELHGWFIAAETEKPLATTIYFHGNGGNITHRPDHIQAITAAGSDLLIIDYRGYGKSEGSPSEHGIYLDGLAAFDWLTTEGRTRGPVICHGESLGTAVATEVAVNRACDGVILEAPFTSRAAVAAQMVPVIGPLVASGFETAKKIPSIECPLLVIHGTDDQVLSPEFGLEVFEAARSPKEFWSVEQAGHNDIVHTAGAEYGRRLTRFYLQLL